MERDDPRRRLPSVHAVAEHRLLAGWPRGLVVDVARARLAAAREVPPADAPVTLTAWAEAVALDLERVLAPAFRGVINATGVVLHTNLGRAPWDPQAVEAAQRVAGRYCDLEIDRVAGARGDRLHRVSDRLTRLTGAEAALAVNNGAAGLLLALTALARGREVVVSRGELVEIGGSFRVPEIIEAGGATLREVGTTNRTHLRDMEAATHASTGALLRVHPSNFRVSGYTAAVSREALVELGARYQVPVVEDQGSGALDGDGVEPGVRDALAAGVDLVLCSADKLLGGPQAGLILGREPVIRRLRAHPMYRALRLDKVMLAALDATVRMWLSAEVPVSARALRHDVREPTERLVAALRARGVPARMERHAGAAGGGSWADVGIEGWAVVLPENAEAVARRLWRGQPPVRARVREGAVWLDLRAVFDDELGDLEEAVCSAYAGG